jgi:hypothetical protein
MLEAPHVVQIGPAPAIAEPAKAHSCGCKKRYCPRKIQSASGVVFGVMMVQHLAVNFLGLWPARYQAAVDRIYGLASISTTTFYPNVFVPHGFRTALILWLPRLVALVQRGTDTTKC